MKAIKKIFVKCIIDYLTKVNAKEDTQSLVEGGKYLQNAYIC